MELAAAFAEEDNLDGFQDDADFQKEGHILYVKKVVLKLFNGIFYGCTVTVIYLSPTRNSRDHYDIGENNGRK